MEVFFFLAGTAFFYINKLQLLFLALVIFLFRAKPVFIALFCFGTLWANIHQWFIEDKGMPKQAVVNQALLEGFVASIPAHKTNGTQFQFQLSKLNGAEVTADVLLTCYRQCPTLHPGEYWRLRANIKRPRNFQNPGQFDYAGWLNVRHMHWVGYVRQGTFKQLKSQHNPYPFLKLREQRALMLEQRLPNKQSLSIAQALTLGVTNQMSEADWELFRHTGTIHLMVISGAHIGFVGGMVYWFVRRAWSHSSRLCLRIPAQKTASVATLVAVFVYAVMAGFGIPVQRALVVCVFVLLKNICSKRFTSWQTWRYALLVVVLIEPHSLLMSGFYLSFIAVAILLLINQRVQGGGIKKAICMQTACLIGLMPFTLYWFSYGAINGFIANLIAIPWVGFVIIPLAFILLLLGEWFAMPWLIEAYNTCLKSLFIVLQWIDSHASWNIQHVFSQATSPILISLALLIIYFFYLNRLVFAAVGLMLAGLFPFQEIIKQGEARIDVLDVGQGLSVLIRTARHALLYDTGVKFYRGTDMGKLVIIPYLESLNIQRLDKIIISHSDLDHRGGLPTLEAKYNNTELIVDDARYYQRGKSCHHYPAWIWDDVMFRFFPIKKRLKGKNNNSCVLKIYTATDQMLLTGDIERPAERYLTDVYQDDLKSTYMLIPHHGSKTSSTLSFIKQISPFYAINSYGFNNRYRFPHQVAMKNYQKEKISVYNTVDCGMVSVFLTKRARMPPRCYTDRNF